MYRLTLAVPLVPGKQCCKGTMADVHACFALLCVRISTWTRAVFAVAANQVCHGSSATQAECKRLLAELLHAPALHTGSFRALQTNLQTQSSWLRGADAASGSQRDASGLSFSFDVQARRARAARTLLRRALHFVRDRVWAPQSWAEGLPSHRRWP